MIEDINKAIEHFEYGISHDIFKEPVRSYAKLVVDALKNYEEFEEGRKTKKTKATIYDLHRMCKYYDGDCSECPLKSFACAIDKDINKEELDEINDAISEWILSHSAKTRQDVFLEQYPETELTADGLIEICPCALSKKYQSYTGVCDADCNKCRREYWLEEFE